MTKQYIVYYPHGDSLDVLTNKRVSNNELATTLVKGLEAGRSAAIPVGWNVQVVDLDPPTISREEWDEKFEELKARDLTQLNTFDPLNPENLSQEEISDRLNKGFAIL
jgi:hypothetical protein